MKKYILSLLVAVGLIGSATAETLNGFLINYYTFATPTEYTVYNGNFISDYNYLNYTYGNSAGGNSPTILSWWDDTPSTRLRAAAGFGYDIVPTQLPNGLYFGVYNVSVNWLTALQQSPSLQNNYQFSLVPSYADALSLPPSTSDLVPEPSTYALFGIGAIGMLMVMRRKKTA